MSVEVSYAVEPTLWTHKISGRFGTFGTLGLTLPSLLLDVSTLQSTLVEKRLDLRVGLILHEPNA